MTGENPTSITLPKDELKANPQKHAKISKSMLSKHETGIELTMLLIDLFLIITCKR